MFDGSKLKVKRANSHIKALSEWDANFFVREKSYFVEEVPNPDGLTKTRVVRVRNQIPADTSCLIGDAVHNLRASLDLLACDLVRLNNASADNVYFPFCRNASELENMIQRRNMHRAAPDIVDLVRAMKPYKDGNPMLRGIHDLDITDKHHSLIPVASAALQASLILSFTGGPLAHMRSKDDCYVQNVSDGTVLDTNMPVDFQTFEHDPIFQLAFAPGDPFEGEPISGTLEKLAKLSAGVIQTFETHLRGRN